MTANVSDNTPTPGGEQVPSASSSEPPKPRVYVNLRHKRRPAEPKPWFEPAPAGEPAKAPVNDLKPGEIRLHLLHEATTSEGVISCRPLDLSEASGNINGRRMASYETFCKLIDITVNSFKTDLWDWLQKQEPTNNSRSPADTHRNNPDTLPDVVTQLSGTRPLPPVSED